MEINRQLKNNIINIVYITDERYLPNTLISIYSVKRNRNKNYIYNVYVILDKNVSKTKFLYLLEEEGFFISILENKYDISGFERKDFPVSVSACIKFHLADLLYNVDKVLYLDGDTIIQSDLSRLYEIEINSVYAAVVRDTIAENMLPTIMDKLKSNLQFYFNSGVMLLNLKAIRADGLQEKMIEYRLNGINYFMDQDALNIVFNERVKYISEEFNYMITKMDNCSNHTVPNMHNRNIFQTEYIKFVVSDIIHLTGKKKPWKEYVPYATALFMWYYIQSPFRDILEFNPCIEEKNMREEYIFPFARVEKNCKIVIWGAGRVGQDFYKQVQKTGFCKIEYIIDEYADLYNKDTEVWNNVERIYEPEIIEKCKFDYIVIAVKNKRIEENIIERILEINPHIREKIVWEYPVL